MFSMIKFCIYFVISFAILCIPFGQNQRVFDALYSWVSPHAKEAINTTKQKISTTSRYSKKLFSNSTPSNNDEVSLTKSALQKNDLEEEMNGSDDGIDLAEETNHTYTAEEKEQILKALKN